jgi:hypothetical protein
VEAEGEGEEGGGDGDGGEGDGAEGDHSGVGGLLHQGRLVLILMHFLVHLE